MRGLRVKTTEQPTKKGNMTPHTATLPNLMHLILPAAVFERIWVGCSTAHEFHSFSERRGSVNMSYI